MVKVDLPSNHNNYEEGNIAVRLTAIENQEGIHGGHIWGVIQTVLRRQAN